MYDKRVSSLINIIEQKDLDGVIITSRDNTMYLSSFSGTDSILVFTRKKAYFATDFDILRQLLPYQHTVMKWF
jgi:Xaa-Pro aminopeptidase